MSVSRSQNDGAILPKIVLTDFYTRTCGFCREEDLIIEELTEVFARDGRVQDGRRRRWTRSSQKNTSYFSVPTQIIERGGELVERWNGFVPGYELERALKEALR